MKKKFLAALICAALALNLTGCANNSNEDPVRSDKSSKESSTSSVVSEPSDSGSSDPANSDSKPEESKPSEPAYPEATNVLYAQGKKLDFPETPLSDFDYEIKDNYAVIKEYFGKNPDVRIPETIEGKPVQLGSNGGAFFNDHGAIKRLILPDYLGVSQNASISFTALESLTFLGSVNCTNLSFSGARNLSSIYFGGALPECSKLEVYFGSTAWMGAIKNHDGLVVIGDTVTLSANCTGDIVIPKGVTKIDNNAFALIRSSSSTSVEDIYQAAKLNSVKLPEGLKEIGSMAFATTGLTEINIPESVTSIGQYAFYNTPYQKGLYNDDKLAIDGKWLLEGSGAFGHVTVPNSVTHIAGGAFGSAMKSLTVPDSVEYADYGAFKSLFYLDEYKNSDVAVFGKVAAINRIEVKDSTLTIPDGVKCVSLSYDISMGRVGIGGVSLLGNASYPLKSLILPDSICYYGSHLGECAEEITYKETTYQTRGDNYAEERAALQAAIEGN